MSITIGSLFSGYGGLDMAVSMAIPGTRTAWVSDIDPGACAVLAERYPSVPNLGDITAVDWADVPPVDIICGGSPCQDLSSAGARKGMSEGTRSNLWVQMRDAIATIRPRLVVWENVRGALSARATSELESGPGRVGEAGHPGPVLRALGRVLGDLASLGYDACWTGLRASDVGACHGRFRVFVLAWDARRGGLPDWARPAAQGGTPTPNPGRDREQQREPQVTGLRPITGTSPDGGTGPTADADSLELWDADEPRGGPAPQSRDDGQAEPVSHPYRQGLEGRQTSGRAPELTAWANRLGDARRWVEPASWGCPACRGLDAECGTCNLEIRVAHGWGKWEPAVRRWERILGREAPSAVYKYRTRDGQTTSVLSPRFVEWMMGLAPNHVTDVDELTRRQLLHILGNGVVPQQGAVAIRYMLRQAIIATESLGVAA